MKWWDTSWNPVVGCSPASPGCDNCYAKRLHDQRHAAYLDGKKVPSCYVNEFGTITGLPERLDAPLHWRKPRRVFVNSMSDLFHPAVPFDFLDRVFAVMAMCPQHTFIICTKRPERMREYLGEQESWSGRVLAIRQATGGYLAFAEDKTSPITFPLPNVWLGVTAENQSMADERIPSLLLVPAAKRFVSVEPMLGPMELRDWWLRASPSAAYNAGLITYQMPAWTRIGCHVLDWVICGGETGPNARPMHPNWARGLRDQCEAAGVPFFFKQWGEWHPSSEHDPRTCSARQDALHHDGQRETRPTEVLGLVANQVPGWAGMCQVGSRRAGRLLDGREHNDIPEVRHA